MNHPAFPGACIKIVHEVKSSTVKGVDLAVFFMQEQFWGIKRTAPAFSS
jgi:hypothetical protein